MKNYLFPVLITLAILVSCKAQNKANGDGWISLFDGKSLNGWKVGANASTFSVKDGAIVANGPVAHLFYVGDVKNHDFKNFEFKADVMTTPGSNSGLYFHTAYQDSSWPVKGYEVQVNNSHEDWRRTGSLYAIQDVKETYVKDNEWYTESIIVKDKHVTVKINDKAVVDYDEPVNVQREKGKTIGLISLTCPNRGIPSFHPGNPSSPRVFLFVKSLQTVRE